MEIATIVLIIIGVVVALTGFSILGWIGKLLGFAFDIFGEGLNTFFSGCLGKPIGCIVQILVIIFVLMLAAAII